MKLTHHFPATVFVGLSALLLNMADAAIVFTDSGFENGGSVNQDTSASYVIGAANVTSSPNPTALSALSEGVWIVRGTNDGSNTTTSSGGAWARNGQLVRSNQYRSSQTTVPAGVTGNQFYTLSRAQNQMRGFMQYVDTGGTSGDVTINLDYWVSELGGWIGSSGGSVWISYEIFAFNDPNLIGFQSSTATTTPNDGNGYAVYGRNTGADPWIRGATSYVGSGGTYVEYDSTAPGSGFQTLSETLNLGATSYQYIGVAVGVYGDDGRAASGQVANFDNLAVVPEPAAAFLSCFGALLLLRRRR